MKLIFTIIGLLAVIILVSFSDRACAEKEPEWSYITDNEVKSVAISSNGEYIATGSFDNKVYLFNKNTSVPLWNHSTGERVFSVAISSNGEYIAAGSDDTNVYLFNKHNSTPLWNYTTGDCVRFIAISSDGKYIAAGSKDKKVYLFDYNSSTPRWSYAPRKDIFSLAISSNGEYIGVGFYDNTVSLLHKNSSTPLWNYTTGDCVRSIAISSNGEYIVAGSYDDKVYLFDKDTSTPLRNYSAGDNICSVAISSDGEYIVAGSKDNMVYLFHKDTSTPIWSYTSGNYILSVAISLDGEYITAGSMDKKVYFFNRYNPNPIWNYTTGDWIYSVSTSSDGSYIVAGSKDDNVYLFNNNKEPVATIESISPNPAVEFSSVHFKGRGTDDGSIERYAWRTDDVELYNDTSSEFYYSGLSHGTYTFFFKVMDNHGVWSDEVNHSLIIHEKPVTIIESIYPNPALESDTVHFKGNGTDDGWIERYSWRANDIEFYNNTSSEYCISGSSPGTYTISFKAMDNYGIWSDEVTQLLIIHERPVATILSISPNPAIENDSVLFKGSGWDDGTIKRYAWRSSIDDEFYNGTKSEFHRSNLSFGTHQIYFKVKDNYEIWSEEVSSSIQILRDTDGDLIADLWDDFPGDPAASKDSDHDGYPDEWNPNKSQKDSTSGLSLDEFPYDNEEWKDTDGDGVGDNEDDFPTTPFLSKYCQVYIIVVPLIIIVAIKKSKKYKMKKATKRMLTSLTANYDQLKAEQIQFDDSLYQQAVSEFQHRKYKRAQNYATTASYQIDKVRSDFDNLRNRLLDMETKMRKASQRFNVSDILLHLDSAKKAFAQRDLGKTTHYLNECQRSLQTAHRNAMPILSITIPDVSIPTVKHWHRIKGRIRNDGAAHARHVTCVLEKKGEVKINPIKEIRSGEEVEVEIGIKVNESGNVPLGFLISAIRPQDNKPFTNRSDLWLNVGAHYPVEAPSIQTGNMKILCDTENFRGFIRAKIAIVNNTGAVITYSKLRIITDNKVLRFDHVEPAYITHGAEIDLGNVNHREKKTVAIYLDPMICTTTGLDATFTYRDIKGHIQMEKMRRQSVIVVCPIFFTQETANPAMLKNLITNVLNQQDSKIFTIPRNLKPSEAFEITKSAIRGRSVNFVREFFDPMPYVAEAWYYAVTKSTKMQMVIKIAVREDTNSIQIFAASQSEEALVGLLAELGHDLMKKLNEKGMPVVQVTNVTIKDNIINRSSLLFGEELKDESNIDISDSIIQRSELGGDPASGTSVVTQHIRSQSTQASARYKYDIAISYASEDRAIVDQYANLLLKNNVNLFYDRSEQSFLWGKDLNFDLSDIYERNAKYCVMFISKSYVYKWWTEQERLAAQIRALKESSEYILPIRLDDTEIPGFPPSIIFQDIRKTSINELVKITLQKLRSS